MRQVVLIAGIAVAAVGTAAAIKFIPPLLEKTSTPVAVISYENESQDFEKAARLLEQSHPEQALEIIQQYKSQIETLSPQGLKWLDLFIAASFESRDIQQLIYLFEFFPEIYKENENASLLVADAYISGNRSKDYTKIRSLWTDRETKTAAWFVLDVDQLLLEGRRQEAVTMLKSRTFNDKADVGRLVRLALLFANEDPKQSWTYLGEAYSKDPQNPDVRSYRARLLESVGKNSLAHKEYQSASRLDQKNLFLKEQLADFYLRQKQYLLALDLWKENLTAPSLDSFWVKAQFWNRTVKPINFKWNDTPIPQGRLDPLIQFLIQLKPDEFWNQSAFEHVTNGKYFLRNQQETFWLRLIDFLKKNSESDAYKLLKYNPFTSTSWYPELEIALKRTMNYRQNGSLKLDTADMPPETLSSVLPKEAVHPFFIQLEELAASGDLEVPKDVQELLKSKEAFSAIFLAAGWTEAGLALHSTPVIPNEFPDWVASTLTQALQQNRSVVEAMEFASIQKPTPELSLQIAELLIAGGNADAALEKLNKLATQESAIGYRSAWLASLLLIDKKDYEHAKTVINLQPRLVHDVLGQETLARIAYLEGNTELADKLYGALEKTSPEARSYLARKAFNEKKWKRARELTELLIVDYPENPMLKENLKKIIAEQGQISSQ